MGYVAEYDFETLDPVTPAMSPVDQAAAVMDVLAEARAEADQIRRQALEEGYAAGRHEALEALAPALAALAAATEEVRVAQADTASELERRAVELGMALASKVLAGA